MLDLYKNNSKNKMLFIKKYKQDNISKHYPSSVREWNNSIYLYNNKNLNLIPFTTKYTQKIIKSFFNFYNKDLEKKIRFKRLLLRLRRLSSNKIFISKGEFKHTNNNVLINLYVYNKQKNNYLNKLRYIYLNNIIKTNSNIDINLIKILKVIYKEGFNIIKKFNNNKYPLIKALNIIEKDRNFKVTTFKSLSSYISTFYKNFLKKSVKRLRMFYLHKQLIYINKSKFNYNYLLLLKKHLENMYNKNVIFNIINIERSYLNSDILSESVKLKLTRNRKKLRKIFNKMKNKINIHKKQTYIKNYLSNYLTNIMNENKIINNLKYRHITGFRIEAKGRLTKRYTASRSLHKLKYKGNLLNIDSSHRGISSVILKGNLKSNIQYTKLNSKTRIGSFGLKGWISSN